MTELPRFCRDPGTHFFLFGPRGTGKSTWLRSAHPDALWIDLLEPDVERQLSAHPETLRQMVDANPDRRVVVVDEVQRAPAVLTVVHQLIEQRKRQHRFVLTGSSARKLKRTGVDLLGGRALRMAMHPFMAAELGTRFDLARALAGGLIPGVLGSPSPVKALQAYVSLYIREEVKAEGMVRNLGAFSRFLESISFSHGSVLNLSGVARECQVSRVTAAGYLEVIEDLLLAFRLPVFSRRAKRVLTEHPKFYWFDAGVFRAVRPAGPLDRPEEMEGAALEGLVAQHLRAWIDYGETEVALHFWRTKSGNEVDFVLYGRDGFWALEVKNRARVFPGDLRGLQAFREDYPMARTALLYRGRARLKVGGILCLPCEEFLAGLRPGKELPIGSG
jgi:predicted AAA+ superfamily ATPase